MTVYTILEADFPESSKYLGSNPIVISPPPVDDNSQTGGAIGNGPPPVDSNSQGGGGATGRGLIGGGATGGTLYIKPIPENKTNYFLIISIMLLIIVPVVYVSLKKNKK